MTTRIKKIASCIIVCAFVVLASIFPLCSCSPGNNLDLGDTSKINLVKKGTLTVGISPGFAPFESYIDGTIQGIDVDVAEMIAADLKLKVDYKTIKYDSLLSAVNKNEVDIAISALPITSANKKLCSFSSSYYNDEKIFVAKAGSSVNEKNIEQALKNPNTKVACIKSSTAEDYLSANYGSLKKLTFTNNKEIIDALNNNTCDLALIYKSVLDVYPDSKLALISEVGEKDECAIAVDKSNIDLLQVINKVLSARTSDGTLTKIINKWLYEA